MEYINVLNSLYARLQYGITAEIFYKNTGERIVRQLDIDDLQFCKGVIIRPYLRPLSKMTRNEKSRLGKRYLFSITGNSINIRHHSEGLWDTETDARLEDYIWLIDWFNRHHFDYQGMIDNFMALEAPDDMYLNKN